MPWQEVPDSNCERRSIPSRPGVGWSKIGRRRPIAACVSAFARSRGSHFPSFRRAARARYLLRSAKRGFLSKVNCLKYDSSAKGAKIGPFPRYDERSTSPSRPSSNSRDYVIPNVSGTPKIIHPATRGHSIPAAPPSQWVSHHEPVSQSHRISESWRSIHLTRLRAVERKSPKRTFPPKSIAALVLADANSPVAGKLKTKRELTVAPK